MILISQAHRGGRLCTVVLHPLRNVGVRSGESLVGWRASPKEIGWCSVGWIVGWLIPQRSCCLANPFSHVKSNNCVSSFFRILRLCSLQILWTYRSWDMLIPCPGWYFIPSVARFNNPSRPGLCHQVWCKQSHNESLEWNVHQHYSRGYECKEYNVLVTRLWEATQAL